MLNRRRLSLSLTMALIALIASSVVFVGLISSQPMMIGTTTQANPYESNPGARATLNLWSLYEMIPTSPYSAADGSFDTYARWEWHPSLLSTAYYQLSSFDSTPPTSFSIGWVDLKVSYKCPATMNDKYRIVYRVAPSATWIELQTWVWSSSAKFDYNGMQSHRAFSNIAEPNDGIWDWTDISNVEFRVELQMVAGKDTPYKQFYLYEVWLTVYEGSYPPAGPGVSIQPTNVTGLNPWEMFFVEVFVTDVVQMHGFQFVIRYNPHVLTAIDYFAYNPFILKAPSAVSELTYLSVNSFDNTRPGWMQVGASPYLSKVDYPTNFISETADGEIIGDFSFDDLVTPNYGSNVYIELNATSADGDDQIELWLYDGTAWTLADTVTPPVTWPDPMMGETWTTSVDVGPILDTMAKINDAKVYLVKKTVSTPGEVIVDAMRLTCTSGYVAVSYSSWMGDPTGFTGSGPVVRIYFMVDNPAMCPLHFETAVITDVYGSVMTPQYVYDGAYWGPRWLSSIGSLIDLANPVSTMWHEIYPTYSQEYHLTSWEDNGDGYLSASDQIDMEQTYPEPGPIKWYHVDEVTITIHWTFKDGAMEPTGEPGAAEPEEPMTEMPPGSPIGSRWHQIYGPPPPYWPTGTPGYCRYFTITSWEDTGGEPGVFDPSDQFDFEYDDEPGVPYWAHLDDVTTDIIITEKPGPVPEFPLGLSLIMMLAPIIPLVYIWRARKRAVKK